MALADFFADTSELPPLLHPDITRFVIAYGCGRYKLTRTASGSWADDMPELPTARMFRLSVDLGMIG